MRARLFVSIACLLGSAAHAAPFVVVSGDDRGADAVGASNFCQGGWLQTITAALRHHLLRDDPSHLVDAYAQPGDLAATLDDAIAQARAASAKYALWAVVKPDASAAPCKNPHKEWCDYSSDLSVVEVQSKKVLLHIHLAKDGVDICNAIGADGNAAAPLYELLDREDTKQVVAAAAQRKTEQEQAEVKRKLEQQQADAKRKADEESELTFVRYRPGQRLAVLEFETALPNKNQFDRLALSDQVRSIPATRAPGLLVMTRENEVQIIQASGKALADCEGECETATGRQLGADYVVSGRLYQSGANVRAMLKLFRTSDGALLSTASTTGHDQDSMETGIEQAAGKLFSVLKRQ